MPLSPHDLHAPDERGDEEAVLEDAVEEAEGDEGLHAGREGQEDAHRHRQQAAGDQGEPATVP